MLFGLDSRQAAVDRQVDPGDVAALVGVHRGGHHLFDEGRARKNHIDLALLRNGFVDHTRSRGEEASARTGEHSDDVQRRVGLIGAAVVGLDNRPDDVIVGSGTAHRALVGVVGKFIADVLVLICSIADLLSEAFGVSCLVRAWSIQTFPATVRAAFQGRPLPTLTPSWCAVSFHCRDNALGQRSSAVADARRIRGDRSGGNTLRIEHREAGGARAIGAEAGVIEQSQAWPK